MIGYRYPIQGLQPFTKTFGQPLHEPDVEEYSSKEPPPVQQNHDIIVDAKFAASQIEKSMRFSYDSDDSDASGRLEETSEQHPPPEDNAEFLTNHSDILPSDAPIDTINTLKALKYHIETSENRCFTNLERQLLATIVQHGIFNANKEESVPDLNEQVELGEQVQQSEIQQMDVHQGEIQPKETQTSQVVHESTSSVRNNQNELEVNTDIQSAHSSTTQVPPNLEENHIRENITPSDTQSVSRKALLPTPGSYDEVSHVIMSENTGAMNFSKPTLPITEQKKLSKTVKSLKISDKLARIQNSYHPDDEPTLQLLESMAKKTEEESGYDDLLKSYSKTKSQLEVEKEPKYKSKTKILPPSAEFLKRQEKHNASRHERYEKMQYDSQSHSSNRRVVRREDYEREKRSKDQDREPSRRRVKLNYKEDTPDHNLQIPKSQSSYLDIERRGKRNSKNNSKNNSKSNSPETEVAVEKNINASTEEKAVDLLANLITQKFLSTMTEVEELPGSKGQDMEPTAPQTIAQPVSTLHSNFPAPPFIHGHGPPFFPPPLPMMAANVPIMSAPLPIVTGPMMVHPGPVKRSNLITINLDTSPKKTKKNVVLKDSLTDSSAIVLTQVIDLEDVEEGEIS